MEEDLFQNRLEMVAGHVVDGLVISQCNSDENPIVTAGVPCGYVIPDPNSVQLDMLTDVLLVDGSALGRTDSCEESEAADDAYLYRSQLLNNICRSPCCGCRLYARGCLRQCTRLLLPPADLPDRAHARGLSVERYRHQMFV
eukprot:SAG11_NODE_10844_length_802_cov_1.132290_2_plen_141_part_01